MAVDYRLVSDVAAAEGRRLTAYRDTRGFWTIGYGHLLEPQSQDWTAYTIAPAQALAWLSDDIQAAQTQVATLPEWQQLDTQCRQNAVIECAYNLGFGHWRDAFPGTRSAIASQDWQAAHDKLLQSPEWIAQVGLARVTRLARYLLTGQYPGSTSATGS